MLRCKQASLCSKQPATCAPLLADVGSTAYVQGGPAVLWQRYMPQGEDDGHTSGAADISLFFGGGDGVKSCIHYELIVPSELSEALPHSQRESLYHMKSSTFLRQGYH